jgi:hypothetical protein
MVLKRDRLSLAKYQVLVLSLNPMKSLALLTPASTYLNIFVLYQSVFFPVDEMYMLSYT